jgi:hypothetical protein
MLTTLGDQQVHGGVVNWPQSVRTPFTVMLFDGPHPDLRKEFFAAESEARSRRVGTAVRIWRSKRRRTVTYLTPRSGTWSADARRVGPLHRLYLVGFARLP